MKKDLLICIAFHYSRDRIKYVYELIKNFNDNYKCSFDIFIDTNMIVHHTDPGFAYMSHCSCFLHENLKHPFHLTWQHRKHFKENIDNYENFMYVEDDMLLPYENYLNYLENFKLLWPRAIPSFVRIETNGSGEEFITDATERQKLEIAFIEGKHFTTLKNPYHAFWIMPAKELKETMTANFNRLHESRETAASYPMWELLKTPLVEIENGQISKKCYSYHLPNNYTLSKESQFAKIKPNEIFI